MAVWMTERGPNRRKGTDGDQPRHAARDRLSLLSGGTAVLELLIIALLLGVDSVPPLAI